MVRFVPLQCLSAIAAAMAVLSLTMVRAQGGANMALDLLLEASNFWSRPPVEFMEDGGPFGFR